MATIVARAVLVGHMMSKTYLTRNTSGENQAMSQEKRKIDTQLATFWYHLLEHGLEPDSINFLETLGTLNRKHPIEFIVEAVEGYIMYLSQEPDNEGDTPISH